MKYEEDMLSLLFLHNYGMHSDWLADVDPEVIALCFHMMLKVLINSLPEAFLH